jgi:hypothetical protein
MNTRRRRKQTSTPTKRRLVIAILNLSIVITSAQHAGTTSNAQSLVDQETEVKLLSISASYEQNMDAVVEKLLKRVVLVEAELHRNVKKE